MGSSVEFQPYLDSIIHHYGKWQRLYTLTDAEGRKAEEDEETPFFDFGLMVQSVAKAKPGESLDISKKLQDKIERSEVLAGLRQRIAADQEKPHVLLIGRPGSGKSTALARLMLKLIEEGKVPILVELRSWQTSVVELVQSFFKRHNFLLSVGEVEVLLDAKRLVLLVDGVNELPSEAARRDVHKFRKNHPKVPMVFTTRDLGLGGDLGIGKKLEMQPLTEKQMRAFAEAYLPGKADKMLLQLKGRLWELSQTPLLLWMLCEVFKQSPDRNLPSDLGGILQIFTNSYEQSSVRKHEVAALKGDVRPLVMQKTFVSLKLRKE